MYVWEPGGYYANFGSIWCIFSSLLYDHSFVVLDKALATLGLVSIFPPIREGADGLRGMYEGSVMQSCVVGCIYMSCFLFVVGVGYFMFFCYKMSLWLFVLGMSVLYSCSICSIVREDLCGGYWRVWCMSGVWYVGWAWWVACVA